MKYLRGDVVLVNYPFADQTGSKVRPALVVQADVWNRRLECTILAMITSSPRRRVDAETQLAIDLNHPDADFGQIRLFNVKTWSLISTQESYDIWDDSQTR